MGKKAREKRTREKRVARSLGYRENEYGELKSTIGISKAAARRQFIFQVYSGQDIVRYANWRAMEEIRAAEDARVFAILDQLGTGSTDPELIV